MILNKFLIFYIIFKMFYMHLIFEFEFKYVQKIKSAE
jgi:hypothetical protein